MTQPPRIQAGTTRLFSVQYSSAPISVPLFSVLIDSSEVAVASVTATISAATAYQYQQTFTMPTNSPGVYAFAWTATFTPALVDVTRGLFQVMHRAAWTS